MLHIDIILLAYYVGMFMFGLNGILWMALHKKQAEIKSSEERIIRLLTRSRLRR